MQERPDYLVSIDFRMEFETICEDLYDEFEREIVQMKQRERNEFIKHGMNQYAQALFEDS